VKLRYFNLIILCLLVLTACSTPPIKSPPWVGKYKNACLPEAIAMSEGLKSSGVAAKVMSIHTENWGHAVCVYLYPTGKNKLWVWDSYWQSVNLRAWWNNSASISESWMRWRYDTTPVKYSYFHEP
jgi:hypothetical protein